MPIPDQSTDAVAAKSDTPRPNLLVIGAMKASTSLLFELIKKHPDSCMSSTKELSFFDADRSDADWAKYLENFRGCPSDSRIIGEASPSYTLAPSGKDVPQRIRRWLGQPKLVYILRDPFERLVSHHLHGCVAGNWNQMEPFLESIDKHPVLLCTSHYAMILRRFTDEFGPDSVHIAIAERLHREPAEELAKLASYLQVDFPADWARPIERFNSNDQLRRAKVLNEMKQRHPRLGKFVYSLPRPISNPLRRLAVRVANPAKPNHLPISVDGRRAVLERIEDDLRELRVLLGSRIDPWPSVQTLGL